MARPMVAIVGRPNVGKSTLFNRIVRERVSIVEGTPGVTRDRIYGHAEWLNRRFTLVDTGGLDLTGSDELVQATRNQVQLAVDLADVIIFVVDGRSGVTTADYEVAQVLRLTSKAVVLAVNKIDSLSREAETWSFYELGIGDPISISAEHGKGIGDLLDQVICEWPEDDDDTLAGDATRIAVIGRPNVGKSSLVNRILGEERVIVSEIPGTTRDAVDTFFERDGRSYLLVDTAGLRKKGRIFESVERYSVIRTLRAIDTSDLVLVLIDAVEGVTEQDQRIIGYACDEGRAMVLLINKWDLLKGTGADRSEYSDEVRSRLPFASYAPIHYISATSGWGLSKVLSIADGVMAEFSREVRTSLLNQILNEALVKNPAPSRKGQQLKVFYATQVSSRPPVIRVFVNRASLVHFSFKRYLENEFRAALGFEGTPLILRFSERD